MRYVGKRTWNVKRGVVGGKIPYANTPVPQGRGICIFFPIYYSISKWKIAFK